MIALTVRLQIGGQFLGAKGRPLLNPDMVLQEQRYVDAHHEAGRGLTFGVVVEAVQAFVLRLIETQVPQFH